MKRSDDVDGLFMFWDLARSFKGHPAVLHESIFNALTVQLSSTNRLVQESALHGFGHQKDVRCQPIISKFLETCDDPDLAKYAGQAMAFEVP